MTSRASPNTIHLFEQLVSLFDHESYATLALRFREQFMANQPFPHIVIDDFLPRDLAEILAANFPTPGSSTVKWKSHVNKNVSRQFVEDISSLSTPLRLFANALNSRSFLLFLEAISGIDCLLGDPYFIGGGAMVSGAGDFLNVHADFNWHHKLQAHRRINALLYLTPEWNPEWKGALELWSQDMSEKVHSVLPVFNRLVIFEATSNANHGQPEPLNTPPEIVRRVFSSFYYTTRRDDAEWEAPHFTLYKPVHSPYGMSLQKEYISRAK